MKEPPKLSRHPATQQAYLTHKGKRHYLGKWPENMKTAPVSVYSRWAEKVNELMGGKNSTAGESVAIPEINTDDLIVAELVDRFLSWAEGYYLESNEATSLQSACKELLELYGQTLVARFSPKKLKLVMERMVEKGLTRQGVNKRLGMIKRAFSWGTTEELVPPGVFESIRLVPALRKNHTIAPEAKRLGKVSDELVEKTKPLLAPQVRAIVEILQYSGARPSELVRIRTADIDMQDPRCWKYFPSKHKTQNRDAMSERHRVVPLGPRCIKAIRPWLKPDDPQAFLFSPAERLKELRIVMRENRKTKVQPSQIDRSKENPEWSPGECYSSASLGRAIRRACKRAGIDIWSPGRLRKSHAQRVLAAVGLESARAYLGHSDSHVTRQHYVVSEWNLAREAAEKVG